MLKMFTTQLSGVFKKIHEKEEFAIEDASRLLAQAPVGDGTIYIFGSKEMEAVSFEATKGAEPLHGAKRLDIEAIPVEINDADRVLLISRFADDSEALQLAKSLQDKGVPFVSICSVSEKESTGTLADLADVHLELGLTKGLLPHDDGTRYGYPSSMAALFVYYAIKFTIEEILDEY